VRKAKIRTENTASSAFAGLKKTDSSWYSAITPAAAAAAHPYSATLNTAFTGVTRRATLTRIVPMVTPHTACENGNAISIGSKTASAALNPWRPRR
jgi:hypothetical protein